MRAREELEAANQRLAAAHERVSQLSLLSRPEMPGKLTSTRGPTVANVATCMQLTMTVVGSNQLGRQLDHD